MSSTSARKHASKRPASDGELDLDSSRTRRRYDRIAPIYDLLEAIPEGLTVRKWRQELWSRVEGTRVLEIGVGTGKNIPYYSPNTSMTAIDLSPTMLRRARQRMTDKRAELLLADAQNMPFPDAFFHTVVATVEDRLSLV